MGSVLAESMVVLPVPVGILVFAGVEVPFTVTESVEVD